MGGISDFIKYSLNSSRDRLKGLGKDVISGGDIRKGNPLKSALSLGGVVNPKRDAKFLDEDTERLFVGEPTKEPGVPKAAPTLKAAPDVEQRKAQRRRVLTDAPKPKSVLGGTR